MMALVPLTRGHYGWMLLVFIVWGIAGFGMMTPQQSRLASLAPAQAPILLSLNTSMLYIGTAIGAAHRRRRVGLRWDSSSSPGSACRSRWQACGASVGPEHTAKTGPVSVRP